jgi:superfamily II DNA or RNA helicase
MTLTDVIQSLGAAPLVRGRQFERLCRWYLKNAPEYRYRLRNVWLWKEWPGRWGPDAGIDLVAETHDGDIWAVQAKAYDPTYNIKKSDVDKFLSESNRPEIAFRLLVATTYGMSPNARRALANQEKPVGLVLRSHLEAADVEWPSGLAALAPTRRPALERRPHQQDAIKDVLAGFEWADRGQLIMACGTGKTLVALWVAEDLGSQRTMVLVPSLTLLSQTLREWTANASEPFDYLAVCSDVTVAEQDAMVSRTADLGLAVTTDASAIQSFVQREGRRVIFATYQSSPRIAEAHARGAPPFDLVVADEAHRCTGPTTTEFTTVLDGDQIRSRRRLFMTATPRYFSDRIKKVAGEADYEVASMDDEDRFGPVFHRLTFGEAIQRDLLSDYLVLVVGVDEDTYRRYVDRREFVTPDGQRVTDARTLASHIGLAKAMRDYGLTRTISFHGRVNKARDFSSTFPAVVDWMPADERPSGQIWAQYVSGEMPTGTRDRRLRQLRTVREGTRALLSNARCLAEGVDVPAIDGVTFIDPRRSTIDIIQAVGRAIRKSPDKTLGVVVLPVFVSDDDDPDRVLEDSSFKPVWDVLKAMRAHDDDLAEILDGLRRSLGRDRAATVARPEKIKLDLPAKVGEEFARAFDLLVVQRCTSNWEFWYGLLLRYVEREGHARVRSDFVDDGLRLGSWTHEQRRAYKRGRLTPAQIDRLQSLPEWSWGTFSDAWEAGFRALQRFVDREGHALVPKRHLEDDLRLGAWIQTQRAAAMAGTLDDDRKARLAALPGWTWDPFADAWEKWFLALQRFVERQGHAIVPMRHLEHGLRLGVWVMLQRRFARNGTLDEQRRARLAALPGWSWDPASDAWERGILALHRFATREGHALVPQNHVEDGFTLGQWVSTQRGANKTGTLDEEKRTRLAAVPGWTPDPYEDAWKRGYQAYQRFVARESHGLVPKGHVENAVRLDLWVYRQRAAARKGTLSQERKALVGALPHWKWKVTSRPQRRPHLWDEKFAKLQQFVEREGHARVPRSHREGDITLGHWVHSERGRYKQGKLQPHLAARLEALPGWVWDAREERASW